MKPDANGRIGRKLSFIYASSFTYALVISCTIGIKFIVQSRFLRLHSTSTESVNKFVRKIFAFLPFPKKSKRRTKTNCQ